MTMALTYRDDHNPGAQHGSQSAFPGFPLGHMHNALAPFGYSVTVQT